MKTFQELYQRVVNVSQRKKMARRMARMAKSPAFQLKKKRTALKMRDPAKLMTIARKKTMQSFRNKFYPDYVNAPFAQKVKIDHMIIQKYGKRIDMISKKLAMKLKRDETERIKKARAAMKKGADA